MSAAAAPTKNEITPDVSIAGMKPGDAEVQVNPVKGGGLVLSPLPVGGRRRKSKKGARRTRRRGGADEEVAPAAAPMGARRRKSKKTKKAGRR